MRKESAQASSSLIVWWFWQDVGTCMKLAQLCLRLNHIFDFRELQQHVVWLHRKTKLQRSYFNVQETIQFTPHQMVLKSKTFKKT